MAKIMEIISKETGGKSYNTEKYSYDTIGMPSFDYDDDGEKFIKWQVSGETEKHKTYVDLTNEAKRQIGKRPVISYFLDGSRHTYKVDDISYNKKVYPVIAGQVGIGCCKRTDGRMRPEKFYRRLVLSLPTVSNAVAHGITNLSNYMLYNFRDKPEHLYYRMKLNVDLCDELGANIYSFPMKYHPINDPDFFMNRDYIGEHWNRKFIRAIQAVLNSTKGKVGKGKHFFEEAFGADEHRFWTILWMPETFIIYRFMFKENLAKEWEEKFWSLPTEELEKVKSVVAVNKFKDLDFSKYSKKARDVLQYYMVTRDEAEQMLKEKNS